MTTRLTVAQAVVRFLERQYVERDGVETAFFAGCWGIFGHGNVAGVGQALLQHEVAGGRLRYLQGRIPDFEQLSLGERRSMTRVANLDPEFIEAGLQAADVYQSAKTILGRSGPELREEDDEIRRWDQVELELKALQSGIHSANLKRKRHLGEAILLLYSVLGSELRVSGGRYLRPYYENMKRAYLRSLKKGRRKKEKKDEE